MVGCTARPDRLGDCRQGWHQAGMGPCGLLFGDECASGVCNRRSYREHWPRLLQVGFPARDTRVEDSNPPAEHHINELPWYRPHGLQEERGGRA